MHKNPENLYTELLIIVISGLAGCGFIFLRTTLLIFFKQASINFLINLFICFWLRWVFVAARGLSLVAVSRVYTLLRCTGFSLRWLLLLRSMGSKRTGFSSCGAWAQ